METKTPPPKTPPQQNNINDIRNIITSALSPTPHETYHERQRLALTSLLSALTKTTTNETYDETITKRNVNDDNNNDCLAYRLLTHDTTEKDDREFHSSLKKLLLWNMARGGGSDDDNDDFTNHPNDKTDDEYQTTTNSHINLRDLSIAVFAAIMETCPGKWLLDRTDDDDGPSTMDDGRPPPPSSSSSSSSSVNYHDHDNATVTGKGRTLCALISLSLGELRLGLGRVVVTNDTDRDDDDIIPSLATKNATNSISHRLRNSLVITKSLVRLLANLADDDDDEKDNGWSELEWDGLLYLKRCLDDAHDVMFQFLASDMHPLLSSGWVRSIALSCVEGIGAWLAETELECVPSPSSAVIRRALRNGAHLCHVVASVGDGRDDRKRRSGGDDETYSSASEPIVYLLPALVKIATSSSSDDLSWITTGTTTTNDNGDQRRRRPPSSYPGITPILISFLSRIVDDDPTTWTNPTFLSTIGWPFAFLAAVYRRDDGVATIERELAFRCLTVLDDCLQPLPTSSYSHI